MPGPFNFDFQPLIAQIGDILGNRPTGTDQLDPNWLASLQDRFQGLDLPRFAGANRSIPGLERKLNPAAGNFGNYTPPVEQQGRPPRPSFPDQLANSMFTQDAQLAQEGKVPRERVPNPYPRKTPINEEGY